MAELDENLDSLEEADSSEIKTEGNQLLSPAKKEPLNLNQNQREKYFEVLKKELYKTQYKKDYLWLYNNHIDVNGNYEDPTKPIFIIEEDKLFENTGINKFLEELKTKHLINLPSTQTIEVVKKKSNDKEKIEIYIKPKEEEYAEEKIKNAKLLKAFKNFASLILTEPYYYKDTKEEQEKELKRIQSELYNLNIYPCFYNFIESSIFGSENATYKSASLLRTVIENDVKFGISVSGATAVATIAASGGAFLIVVGGAFLLVGAGIYGIVSLFDSSTENSARLNYERVLYSLTSRNINDIIYISNIYENEIETIIGKINFDRDLLGELARGDTVAKGAESYLKKVISKHSTIKIFEEEILKSNVASKINNLINKSLQQKLKDKSNNNELSNIFSEDIIGKEYNDYVTWLFDIPVDYDFLNPNDYEAEEIFDIEEIEKNKHIITTSQILIKNDKDLFWPDNHKIGDINSPLTRLFDCQWAKKEEFLESITVKEFYFNKRKKEIEAQQNKKLALLKEMYEMLLEDAAILNFDDIVEKNPRLAEIINEESVFKLLEDSPYPDIITPYNPLLKKRNLEANKYAPWFYYSDSISNGELKKEKEILNNILNKSEEFKNQLADPSAVLFGGASSRLPLKVDTWSPGIFASGDRNSKDFKEIRYDEDKIKFNDSGTTQVPAVTIQEGSEAVNKFLKNLKEQHESNLNEVKSFQKNFGNKYFNNRIEKPVINESLKKLQENIIPEESNQSLTKLSDESFKDYKKHSGIKGAFPTFRLYIVEEDAIHSSRYTAYDDFFSYNSVISFKVHIDKDKSSSTANIQVQNISGILDGTKKFVKRDIDIERSDYTENADDSINNQIQSIVLRKGVNIQLRAGYGASTEDLDVLISGRITEINYSNDNMICNFTVQSYGVELDIVSYGQNAKDNISATFDTTHQLLGSLILNKELKHFGRIRNGKIFQTHENKSPSLDTEKYYDSESFDFNYTYGLYDWFKENETYILIGSLFSGLILKQVGTSFKWLSKTKAGKWTASKYSTIAKNSVVEAGVKGIKTNFKKFDDYLNYKTIWNDTIAKSGFDFADFNLLRLAPAAFYQSGKKAIKGIRWGFGSVYKTNPKLSRLSDEKLLNYLNGNLNKKHADIIEKFIDNKIIKGTTYETIINQELIARGVFLRRAIQGRRWQVFGEFTKGAIMRGGRLAGGGLIISGIAFFADILSNGLSYSWKFIKESFMNAFYEKKNFKRKILLSPQDDNLFCPNPEDYITTKNSFLNAVYRVFYIPAAFFNSETFGVIGASSSLFGLDIFKNDNQNYKNINKFFNKKFIDKEVQFKLINKTIWDTFGECTLRHPGYVRAVRPYGGSMEYRVFFGLPSQRYWSKDIPLLDVVRINRIFEEFSDNGLIPEETLNFLYKNKIEYYKNITEENILTEESIKFFSNLALEEYLEKTKDRFVPIRKFYRVSSKSNLIQNGITVSDHNVINTALVHYLDGNREAQESDSADSAILKSIKISAHGNIPPNLERDTSVKSINIRGVAAAFRYGVSTVLEGMKNIYQGNLLILGNSKIMPIDAVILDDNITKMYGPLEVKSVTHMFSHETGFLTDLEIRAITTYGSDGLTYPMMNASILYQAKEAIFNKYSSRRDYEADLDSLFPEWINDIYLKDVIQDIVDDIVEEINEPINNKDKKELVNLYVEKVKKEINKKKVSFLQDIVNPNFELPQNINNTIENVGITLITTGAIAGLGGTVIEKLANANAAIKVASRTRYGAIVTAALGAATYFSSNKILDAASDSITNGMIGKNLFRPMILSKADNSSLIEVYPLVKDGVPLLAGGLEALNGDSHFYQALGNVFTQFSDAYEGYLKKEKEINSLGEEAPYVMGVDNIWSEMKTAKIENNDNDGISFLQQIKYFVGKDSSDE